jgi:ABC-type Fe3+/spermidine/putrescine transport system ATPase subunit
MIEARGLVKRYGSTAAVNDLTFTIRPGLVTGFLGPNGAGKTTTMRLILGLDYPSTGTVTVNGKPYAQLPSPMHEVGALLDAGAVHSGRTARNHSTHVAMSLSQPGVLRSLIVTALFVEVCGLLAFGIGALVRNTAGALTLAFGCLVLVSELIRTLPVFLHNDLIRWVPGGDSLNSMTATIGGQIPHTFSAWGELAVFAGYAVILLAAGAVAFSRRDA